jgi:3-hydroxyisobutyrate dehydrogenase-like beta-hydroxyacid dehydrogenase
MGTTTKLNQLAAEDHSYNGDLALPSIAFLGLSSLGSTIAARLASAGYPMSVYDVDERSALLWVQRYGGIAASSAAQAATDVDIVICCALGEQEVRNSLIINNGALHSMHPNSIVIDHSSLSERSTMGLKVICENAGMRYVDAACIGSPPDAEQGKLAIFVGSDEASYLELLPLFGAYAGVATRVGDAPAGQRAKLAYQLASQSMVAAVGQLAASAAAANLDQAGLLETAMYALQQQLPEIARLIVYEEQVLGGVSPNQPLSQSPK